MTKEEFEKEQKKILKKVSNLTKELGKLKNEYVVTNSLYKVGDIVEKDGFYKMKYVITEVWMPYYPEISYYATELKADGKKRRWSINHDPRISFRENDVKFKKVG